MIDIKIGDSRKLIKEYKDKTFDCVMTSPPYWELRDYGHDDQLGLEPTPEEYLNTLWNLFDDVKLKLKDEGNCFINLGDTYSTHGSGSKKSNHNFRTAEVARINGIGTLNKRVDSLPEKSLCMIPQRFAWGMIERGWILRNEIIWHKPNHMPESVTDRLTKSHEVIWHFVKQGKYYYNLDEIREPHKTHENKKQNVLNYNGKFNSNQSHETFSSPRARTQRYIKNNDFATGHGNGESGAKFHFGSNISGKNPGDVWRINTQPYPQAHFAVFPIELVRRPILAGCPPGGHVLDPFGGSGTVAEFCRKNDRDCTIFELNPDYKPLIEESAMVKIKPLDNWV